MFIAAIAYAIVFVVLFIIGGFVSLSDGPEYPSDIWNGCVDAVKESWPEFNWLGKLVIVPLTLSIMVPIASGAILVAGIANLPSSLRGVYKFLFLKKKAK